MLTEIYIEALLVDEKLADQVWRAWDTGEIDDLEAWLTWVLIESKISLLNLFVNGQEYRGQLLRR